MQNKPLTILEVKCPDGRVRKFTPRGEYWRTGQRIFDYMPGYIKLHLIGNSNLHGHRSPDGLFHPYPEHSNENYNKLEWLRQVDSVWDEWSRRLDELEEEHKQRVLEAKKRSERAVAILREDIDAGVPRSHESSPEPDSLGEGP